ncbi:MAG: O-antigen ligase family protein [Elusimicrobia bacterium]|nr:O-antigen ligase family protein [Elusimicrobiota bacterium]
MLLLNFKKISRRKFSPAEILFFLIIASVFLENSDFFSFFWLFVPFCVYILFSGASAANADRLKSAIPIFVLIVSVFSIVQYLFKTNPFDAPLPYFTFGNPMYLGSWLAIMLPICFDSMLEYKILTTYHLPLTTVLGFICLLLARSEAAYLGFLAGIFYVALKQKKLKYFFAIFFVTIILYAVFFAKGDVSAKQSLDRRIKYWKVSLAMIKDKPITGVGFGNFRGQYAKYRLREGMLFHTAPRWAHNDIIHFFAELGILRGLIFFLFLFAPLFKKQDNSKIPFKAALISVFFTSLLAFPFDRISTLIPFFLFSGIIRNGSQPPKPTGQSGFFVSYALKTSALILGITLFCYCLFFGYAEVKWKKGQTLFSNKKYALAETELVKAASILSNNREVIFDLARAQYHNRQYGKSILTYGRCLNLYFDWDICYNLFLNFRAVGNSKMAYRFYALAGRVNPLLNLPPERGEKDPLLNLPPPKAGGEIEGGKL